MPTVDIIRGQIVGYDEKAGILTIKAPYNDVATMAKRGYKEAEITLIDSRPLSDKQRRAVYAMIAEIADYSGDDRSSIKEFLKMEFWTTELYQTADNLFSLKNAPVSIIAAFQKWLAAFILRNDIPTRRPIWDYVNDVPAYIYACIINKKCAICGKPADLHHVDRVGMGRDRTDIIHEGLKVLPLCREHHTEAHRTSDNEFFKRYHITDGIPADKSICKIYRLKGAKHAN